MFLLNLFIAKMNNSICQSRINMAPIKSNTICLIYNFAQHYRTNIFCLMDKELPIDFVFGDEHQDVKKMDYSLLKNFKKEVRNISFFIKPLTYQKDVIPLIFSYNKFIMLGDLHCVSTWLMLILSKIFKKKIYFWSHGWYGKESKVKVVLKKIFFSLADGTFLYGNYAKNLMLSYKLDYKKLHVIHNSLDYDLQLYLRNSLNVTSVYQDHFNNTCNNIIFIGRLTLNKRLDILFDALSLLQLKGLNYNLTLIGSGNQEELLKKLSDQKCINVWFYGECYNEHLLSEMIFNADLCVSPGNVGLTAIHSLSYGTPVISHDNYCLQMPEFEAIIDGETGTFFKYNDSFSLSEAIEKWFSQKVDRYDVRQKCFRIIDKEWNPYYQLNIFKSVLN